MFNLFSNKKSKEAVSYNPETQIPILKCSICTGEKVAGFKDKITGKFTEIAFIRSDSELDAFKDKYSISEINKEY